MRKMNAQNKFTKIVFAVLISLLTVSGVFAQVSVTYKFNSNNVNVVGLTCANSDCSQTTTSPFTSTQSTTSGQITVSYPNPAPANGYGVWYLANGYVPLKSMVYIPNSGDESLSYNINFNKKTACRATVESLGVINTGYINEPLQINVGSALDAETNSAFQLSQAQPKFTPSGFDSIFSADTNITLKILDASNNNVVYEQTVQKSIPASTSVNTTFSWTPTISKDYKAVVESKVVDDQCDVSSVIVDNSQKSFSVLVDRPRLQCYTLLNDLEVDKAQPMKNQQLTFTFRKITNEADANVNLVAKDTKVTYTMKNNDNGQLTSVDAVLAASNSAQFSSNSFTFTPTQVGNYTFSVTGKANTCSYVNNIPETLSISMGVLDNTFSATFQIKDDTNNLPINGARVNVFGNGVNIFKTTNLTGEAKVNGLLPGTYTYKLTHSGYLTRTATFTVVDKDVLILATMHPGQGESVTTPDTLEPTAQVQALLVEPIIISNRLMIKQILIVEEALKPEEDLQVLITMKNIGTDELENVRASTFLWDLNQWATAGSIDLSENEEDTVTARLTVPKGQGRNLYPVRFSIGNSDVSRVIHRDIIVK